MDSFWKALWEGDCDIIQKEVSHNNGVVNYRQFNMSVLDYAWKGFLERNGIRQEEAVKEVTVTIDAQFCRLLSSLVSTRNLSCRDDWRGYCLESYEFLNDSIDQAKLEWAEAVDRWMRSCGFKRSTKGFWETGIQTEITGLTRTAMFG